MWWRWSIAGAAAASTAVGALLQPPAALTVVGIVGALLAVLVGGLARERWARFVGVLVLVSCVPMARAAVWARARVDARAWLLRAAAEDRSWPVELSLQADALVEEERVWAPVALHRIGEARFESPLSGVVSVAGTLAAGRAGHWTRGRRLVAFGRLVLPAEYRNFGAVERWPHLTRPTLVTVAVKSAALVDVAARAPPVTEALAQARAFIRRRLMRYLGTEARLALALVLGERTALDEETISRLQRAGVYHVMALSGGNVALVLLAISWIRHVSRAARGTWACAAIALLLGYAGLVAAEPSVVRALAVAALYVAGAACDQRANPIHLLTVVAVAMLAFEPGTVFDVGAWLTFVATLGLIALTKPAQTALMATQRSRGARAHLPMWVVHARAVVLPILAASVAAEVALWPIAAHAFGQVTLLGPMLNLLAIPLAAVVQIGAFAIVTGGDLVARLAALVVQGAVRALLETAKLSDHAPMFVFDVIPPSLGLVAAYYAALVVWTAGEVRWRRRAASLVVVSALWMVSGGWRPASEELVVTALDIGQGDASLVRFPSGHALLFDTGGTGDRDPAFGERVLRPAVLGAGLRRLSHVAFSHADPDHVGGLVSAIGRFRPAEVWEGIAVDGHPVVARARREAERVGAVWRTVQAGDEAQFGDARVSIVHPGAPEWSRVRVRNDDSVVMVIRYHRVAVVLAGDVGSDVERRLLSVALDEDVRIVKMPHHGSRTSSSPAWLQWTRPTVAIASVGARNRFGHPAPDVVERYEAAGALVLRTDRDGAVRIRTDGHRAWVETIGGRHFTFGVPDDGARAP